MRQGCIALVKVVPWAVIEITELVSEVETENELLVAGGPPGSLSWRALGRELLLAE